MSGLERWLEPNSLSKILSLREGVGKDLRTARAEAIKDCAQYIRKCAEDYADYFKGQLDPFIRPDGSCSESTDLVMQIGVRQVRYMNSVAKRLEDAADELP